MRRMLKNLIKKVKLAVLWVRRILFAPDHFGLPFSVRLRMSVSGFVPDQYALYGLKDRHRRKDYLSEFDWYRSRWIDEPFDSMLNNKVVCTEILSPYVLVPKVFAVKTRGEIAASENPDVLACLEDVISLIKRNCSVFVKPISAGKGKGVHRIDWTVNGFHVDDAFAEENDVNALLCEEDDWFLCETMRQSRYLDDLYPNSANTVRLITLRDPQTQAFKILFAVQRIGTRDTGPVDNGSRGGLISCIDLETGVLSEARTLHSLDVYKTHPDTGCPIEGFRIPDWESMKSTALRLARMFPYVRFIAWDMLMTDEGVCVVEANASSGVNIIQLWGPQKNGELGDFYRSQGVLR